MRRRRLAPFLPAAAASLALLSGCASRSRDHLPTLEDYSDGTSTWAEAVLAGWKAGAVPRELLASPAPLERPSAGRRAQEVASRPPLSLRFYAAAGAGKAAPAAGTAAPADLGKRLDAIRSGFASLGRTEATIFDFHRSGADREIVLGLFLSGRGTDGALRQEGGRIRATLSPVSGGGWRMSSGSVVAWLSAVGERAPLRGAGRGGGPRRVRTRRSSRPRRATGPSPASTCRPASAVLDYDGDGRPDLFVPGGDGNHLYRNRGDGTFEDVAEKAGVAGQAGEAVGALVLRLRQRRPAGPLRHLSRPAEPPLPQSRRRHVRGGRREGRRRARRTTAPRPPPSTTTATGCPDLYVLVYGQPELRPEHGGGQRPAEPPLPQQRRRHLHRRHAALGHRRHRLGAGRRVRGPRRRRLARHLRRQRLRQPRLPAQQRRRHVHERREEGRRPRSGLRHGRGDRRLRRRRPPRPLRLELFLPDELVPQGLALPDAALPLLARPAASSGAG